MMILHLTTQTAWNMARQAGEYRAESLAGEGFIHCSTPEQILGVANRFYRDVPGLLLLWINPDQVRAEVRWEAPVHPGLPTDTSSRSEVEEPSPDLFPHIYGPLPLEAVLHIEDFLPEPDGVFRHLPKKHD
jgi:uncharacterized protein (DUF952 family)